MNNRGQRALDRERFKNEKATDERRWSHERETEELTDVRAFQAGALPLRVIIFAIVECCRPVYVQGDMAYEAWDRYNNKLHDHLERDDAAERLGTGYAKLWDFTTRRGIFWRAWQELPRRPEIGISGLPRHHRFKSRTLCSKAQLKCMRALSRLSCQPADQLEGDE